MFYHHWVILDEFNRYVILPNFDEINSQYTGGLIGNYHWEAKNEL
jgi:hypothetical protein